MKNWLNLIIFFSVTIILIIPGTMEVASAEGYVKIGYIQGSSTDVRHSGWSDIISVTTPVARTVAPVLGTPSRTHSAITITKVWDAASPQLMSALASGQSYEEVHIEWYKPGDSGGDVVIHTLKNVTILSINPGIDPKTGAKIESVTLLAEELK